MSESPVERLNYFNGQRLEADDLRLEQEFHIRIQRWLSKSLFSPGVAGGLEVSVVEIEDSTGKGRRVRVTPGLALDDLGRAIILVRPVDLIPQARFLCVRYAERKEGASETECAVRGATPGAVSRAAGPERIVSDAQFTWRTAPPLHDTRELIIAELALNSDCTVSRVISGARLFAVPTQVSKVFSFALEGEKDLDSRNSKLIRFHVTGRTPSAVSLCLRARPFSPLHYTEIASHKHQASASGTGAGGGIQTGPALSVDEHMHSHGTLGAPNHSHTVTAAAHLMGRKTDAGDIDITGQFVSLDKPPSGFDVSKVITDVLNPVSLTADVINALGNLFGLNKETEIWAAKVKLDDTANFMVGPDGGIAVTGSTGLLDRAQPFAADNPQGLHKHDIGITVTNPPIGATGPFDVRVGQQWTYFSNLKISVDGSDRDETTDAILEQLAQLHPEDWHNVTSLNGGVGLPLSTKEGTGLIRLDLLGVRGVSFGPGVHEIEMSLASDADGGGCLQYNLYVE